MRIPALIFALLGLAACAAPTAYPLSQNSRSVSALSHASFVSSNGRSYAIRGYIEMFQPNYFVLVSPVDGQSLADDFAGAALAAREAVARHDCKGQGASVKPGSTYAAAANQWLIVVDCASGGRSLS